MSFLIAEYRSNVPAGDRRNSLRRKDREESPIEMCLWDCSIQLQRKLYMSLQAFIIKSSLIYLACKISQAKSIHCWMNEWMMHLYSAFCVLLYTQSTLQSCGGSLLNHHQCAASTWMMRRLPQDNGASALTTHQLQRREIVKEPIKWMGIIRRPWLIRASGGNLARTPGLHPYSLREVPWDF